MESQSEWDSAYGIYRELVWRFPISWSVWDGLARTAHRLGCEDERAVAELHTRKLRSAQGPEQPLLDGGGKAFTS